MLITCLQSNPAPPTILHPCLPAGYRWYITSGELFTPPCTNWTNGFNGKSVCVSVHHLDAHSTKTGKINAMTIHTQSLCTHKQF